MRSLVFDTMGTTVSLVTPSGSGPGEIEQIFTDADARFSLHRAGSEASRLARGELSLAEASEDFRVVYTLANDWRLATDGAFTSHRPDGIIDLSGVVKAWAMAAAELLLEKHGVKAWCLNVGGDISTRGCESDGTAWTVGIVDPLDRGRLITAATIDPARGAVATSGSAERGDHIWRLGDPSLARFSQVSVAAPDIVMADVLATAIVAAGPSELGAFTENWPIDVFAMVDNGSLLATPRMRAAIDGFRAAP
jgi:thiamine biosynthesis lipoprotein